MPLVPVLVNIESNGSPLRYGSIETIVRALHHKITEYRKEIATSPEKNSTLHPQIGRRRRPFDKLKIVEKLKTKTDSTSPQKRS